MNIAGINGMKTGFIGACFVMCLSCTLNSATKYLAVAAADSTMLKRVVLKNYNDSLRNTSEPFTISYFKNIDTYTLPKPGFQSIIKLDPNCTGCCAAYRRVIDTLANVTVYFVKKDCGSSGFENDQYLFSNGRLLLARNFSVSHNMPGDTLLQNMFIEERIYDFGSEKALIKTRKMKIPLNHNYAFDNEKFTELKGNKTAVLIMKIKEFKNNINF